MFQVIVHGKLRNRYQKSRRKQLQTRPSKIGDTNFVADRLLLEAGNSGGRCEDQDLFHEEAAVTARSREFAILSFQFNKLELLPFREKRLQNRFLN